MVQDSAQFSELVDLDPVLTEIFFQQYEQFTPILRPLVYNVIDGSKAKETFQRIGSFGDPQVFDGQVSYTRADADYQIEMTIDHFTNGFSVGRTLLEDMQYDGIFQNAANLGQSFARFRLKKEASVFDNAFSSAAANLGYDSVALCSASHPMSKTDSTTVSNYLGAKALTATNLEDAIVQLMGIGDDLGNEINAMPTHLIGGFNNRKKIMELTESMLAPESGNNAVNVHAGLTGVIHPYITGNKWFVVDANMARMHLKWINRFGAAQFMSEDDNTQTLVRRYVGRDRFARGWTDFRWVIGSNPS